ncbi:hypothetical protein F5883DRAFT_547039 [Diaporthe sp. PMI_573]|nr:hypothetical protein F5883DRAFT_547039 [Diaporthaceae sp. PMI_573]
MDLCMYLDIEGAGILSRRPLEPEHFAILLKCEGLENFWHSLMEIMSLSTTLEVLQMPPNDASSGRPLRTPQDATNTQVAILDDAVDQFLLRPMAPLRQETHHSPLGSSDPVQHRQHHHPTALGSQPCLAARLGTRLRRAGKYPSRVRSSGH